MSVGETSLGKKARADFRVLSASETVMT